MEEEGEGYETEKQKQIRFFQQIVDRLTTNEMTSNEQRRWSEFYMLEKMLNSIETQHTHFETDEKKMLKYFTLGWYLYEDMGIHK